MKNTRISYLYRDANNNKRHGDVVIEGELTFEQLQPYLDEGEYFAPEDVGLPHPGTRFAGGFPIVSDHPWCKLADDDVEPTRKPATVNVTAAELLEKFKQAAAAEWPAQCDARYDP